MNNQENISSTRSEVSVTTSAPSITPVPDKSGSGFFSMSNGWIKLHRSISKHWVWDNPMYVKGWITILLEVNHEGKKVMIHNELIECNRGQSIHSLGSWVKLFGKHWSVQRVRTFFNLLQKDSMICIEGLHKTTRLTVCNYDKYQDYQQADNKQTTSKQQADNKQITTNKNDKNDKNIYIEPQIDKSEKKTVEEFYKEQLELSGNDVGYKSFVDFLFGTNGQNKKCSNILGLRDQMDFGEYKKIIAHSELLKNTKYKLVDIVMNMENTPNIKSRYVSFYKTLRNWVTISAERASR